MANGILLFLAAICINTVLGYSIVRISEGLVSGGRVKTRSGRKISAFEGIFYAEPPIGPLRFRSPVPKKPWNGVFRAHKANKGCVQPDGDGIKGNEDCLSLNVYTPGALYRSKPLLPVMVYIHGGGYTTGVANRERNGADFLLDKDIVLVTINYRLGILGFLSTGDAAAPGNFGLKDQLLALKWVQRNIRAFGGDPNRVTLFGESAGSSSVHLHALSEKSKPLFQQYIMQSGTTLYPWAFRNNATYYEKAKQVAVKYKCPTVDSYSMVDCLRRLSNTQLFDVMSIFDEVSQLLLMGWGPTIEPESDDAFITEDPVHLMRNGRLKDGPMITGNVKDEGLYFTVNLYSNEELYNIFVNNPVPVIRRLLEVYDPAQQQDLTDLAVKMKNFYLGNEMSKDKYIILQAYTAFVTDLLFFYPQVQFVRYLLRNERQFYLYTFEYRGILSLSSYVTKDNITLGVDHADELFYLFPITPKSLGLPKNMKRTPNDYKVVDLMVDWWTTFAQTSTPTTRHLSDPTIWKPCNWDMTNLKIGNYTAPTATMQFSYYDERMKFWYENVRQYPLDVNNGF